MSKNDITGRTFGYWTVLGRDSEYKDLKRSKWICKCECGTIRSVFKQSLLSGRSTSCGCHSFDNRKGINSTHGMTGTRIYKEWLSMRRRCSPSCQAKDRKSYYEKGIAVCDEWANDFMAFYNWSVKHGYSDSLTIDRIDNSKGYSPDNCRWISIEKQQSNKSTTIAIDYNGKTWCLRNLCNEIGFPYKTAHRRLQRMKAKGKPIDVQKLFEPIHTEKIAVKYRK